MGVSSHTPSMAQAQAHPSIIIPSVESVCWVSPGANLRKLGAGLSLAAAKPLTNCLFPGFLPYQTLEINPG